MSTIEDGDKVTISFVGKLDNGEVFKEISSEQPMVIQIGNSEVPPTLEITLKDMKVGEKQSVRVPPDESYGPREKDLLQTLEISSFGKDLEPKPGMTLSLTVKKDGEDHQVPATVIEVKDGHVTLDYNHPLAGHHLTYEVTVLNIEKTD